MEVSEDEVLEKLSFEDRMKLPVGILEGADRIECKRINRTFEELEETTDKNLFDLGCVIRVKIIGPEENRVIRMENGTIDHSVSGTMVKAELLEIYKKGESIESEPHDIITILDQYCIAEDSEGKLTMYKHNEENVPLEPGMEYIIYSLGGFDSKQYRIYPRGVFLLTKSDLETAAYHKTDEYLDNFAKVKAKYLDEVKNDTEAP